jgi:hypothetical protein
MRLAAIAAMAMGLTICLVLRPAVADSAKPSIEDQLLEELGPAGVSEGEGAGAKHELAGRMRRAEDLLAQAESGDPTQTLQRDIVADLESLVEQAERQCQSCCKSNCQSPCKSCGKSACNGSCQSPCKSCGKSTCNGSCQAASKPGGKPSVKKTPSDPKAADYVKRKNSGGGTDPSRARAGVDRVGPGLKVIKQPGSLEERKELLEGLWGELPPREREQMLQMPVEDFLPKYELLIQDYFRRLSEEQESDAP